MTFLKTVVVLAAISAGCVDYGRVDPSKVVPTPERASAALAAVLPLYRDDGMSVAPTLFYYGGAALDCPNGIDFVWNGECSDGATVSGTAVVLSDCGTAGVDMPVSEMCWASEGLAPALPHELGHALSLQTGGDGCPDHDCPSFKPGGVVERATDLLASLGI